MPFNLHRNVNSGAVNVGGEHCPAGRIFVFSTREQEEALLEAVGRHQLLEAVPFTVVATVPLPVVGEKLDIGKQRIARSEQEHCAALADCALAVQCPYRFSIQAMTAEATAAGIQNMPTSDFTDDGRASS